MHPPDRAPHLLVGARSRLPRRQPHDGKVGMAVLTLTQQISRKPDDVFATIADVGNFASWNPTIKSSRQITPGEAANGVMYEWELRGFGAVQQELQEFEPPRRLRSV